jgi:hypothetical protein
MNDLFANILGTVVGGIILTVILFLANEYFFPKKNLTGVWETTVEITSTSHPPFQNLIMVYKIHLLQKGYELSGSGEKIKDVKADKTETVFEREKRVIIDIEGYYERKIFRKNKTYLNINEQGRIRETRATYFLTIHNNSSMDGNFMSTAADSTGKIRMQRV